MFKNFCKVFFTVVSTCSLLIGVAQDSEVSIKISPYQYGLGRTYERGLGYYPVIAKSISSTDIGLFLSNRIKNRISQRIGLAFTLYRVSSEVSIYEPIDESVILYNKKRRFVLSNFGLTYSIGYRLTEKLVVSSGATVSTVLRNSGSFETINSPVLFFFDLDRAESGVIQYNEYSLRPGFLSFLTIGSEWSLNTKLNVSLDCYLNFWSQKSIYNVNVEGSTANMSDDMSFTLNDTRIRNRYLFIGLGLNYTFISTE